jgi:hypothetical protein
VGAAFHSVPGPVVQDNYVVTERAPGVPLVGSPTATVALLPATGGIAGVGAEYGERLNQLDLRVGKLFRVAGTRNDAQRGLLQLVQRQCGHGRNPSYPAAYRRPTEIMLARLVKISAQFDF